MGHKYLKNMWIQSAEQAWYACARQTCLMGKVLFVLPAVSDDVYAKTSLFRDSFFVRISNLWNALHSDLKSESNVNVFKNKLKHSTSLDYVLYSMLMTSVLSNLSAVNVVGFII